MQSIKSLFLFISFIISVHCLNAQSNTGINYKAIIKDDIGNVIANQSIQIEFTIVYGISQSIAYHEMQSTTTDSNGFINVIIGDGELIDDGDFETIGEVQWQFDTHYLNVKIDSGDGFIDLGTTQLGAVPYALNAKFANNAFSGNFSDLSNIPDLIYPRGLERITENGNSGFRLIEGNSDNFGNIGNNSVDLSFSNSDLADFGATGNTALALGLRTISSGTTSTAMGFETTASGASSTAMGFGTIASGSSSTALGNITIASGRNSTAMGNRTIAPSYVETVIGVFNSDYTPVSTDNFIATDRLFVVGNGTSPGFKSNALTLLKDGRLYIKRKDSTDPNLILEGVSNSASGDNCIITSDPQYAGSDLFLRSNDAVVIELDYDNNEAGQFEVKNGSGTIVFDVNENGDATLTGSLTQNSDRRLKTNIEDLSYGLNEILQLQPKAYNWKSNMENRKSLGLIAQDVQAILSEIVNQQNDEAKTLGISYVELIPVLINAIKEQQKIITSQNIKQSEQDAKLAKLTRDHKKFLRRLRRLEQAK